VFVGAEKLWCRLLVFPADNTRRSQQSKYDQKIPGLFNFPPEVPTAKQKDENLLE
jgi:hypothetical protein